MERSTSDWLLTRILLLVCLGASLNNCQTALDTRRILSEHAARMDSPVVSRWVTASGTEKEYRTLPYQGESNASMRARHDREVAEYQLVHPPR